MLLDMTKLNKMETKLIGLIKGLNTGDLLSLGEDVNGYKVNLVKVSHPSSTENTYEVHYKNASGDRLKHTFFHKAILTSAYDVIMSYDK